jgi:hypothetical protein
MAKQIESYWEILEPFFRAVDTGDTTEVYAASIEKLPHPVVLLYATHICLSEIHNGGLLQFFWNGTGIVAPEAVEGFRTIGMPKLASLVMNVASSLGDPYPRNRDDRWTALLAASGRSESDMERIFAESNNFYLGFVEATEPLGFDVLNEMIWEAANNENGGFQERATAYARETAVQ